MYIDIGANLTHKSFRHDLDHVTERASRAGVEHVIVTGTTVVASQAAMHLARRSRGLLSSTAGVHPHHARDWKEQNVASLRAFAESPCVVAIGECGLDYNRDFSPRPEQRRCFADQLGLAVQLGMPLFLHEREAHDDFLAILREHWASLRGAVVHCFTGTAAELDAYLELGALIGLTGWICDERRGRHLRDLVARIPADRLMVETDAPFITPRTMPDRPRRNEPAFLPHVVETIAKHAGKSAERVARETTEVARRFFRLEGP
jgi:TatD DNase family protein